MSIINKVVSFFKSSAGKKILGLGRQILKIYVGPLAKQLLDMAKEEVARAEAMPISGQAKRIMVFDRIKSRLPEIKDSAIDGALTLAVLALKSK